MMRLTRSRAELITNDISKNMDLLQRDNTIGIDTPSSECAGPASDISDRYYELLYAVETKFPNEFRHETALRYIRERENARRCDCESCKMNR